VGTHKLWDQYPRLDNRYAIRQLAAIHGSNLLISSSAESVATTHDRQTGLLKELITNPIVPKIKIIPLSFDDRRRGHLMPPAALTQLKNAVRRGESTIILHNQRGSWRTAICTECHQALRCPNCESTVFVEGTKAKQRVQCRHCLYTGPLPDRCPNCQSKNLRAFGPGAAKIAATLQALLPSSSIIAVSADKKNVDSRWKSADIVLGTTAIWRYATEESFDHALWIFPESALLYPDYRSSERAYYLLARLQKTIPARRRVTIVTRYIDLVNSSLAAEPEKIMAQLLRERQRLHYPPFTDLVKLTCLARTETGSLDRARAVRQKIDSALPPGVIVRGPYQGFNKKDGQKFAAHILLAGPLDQLVPLYKDLTVDRAELSPAQIL
jgi:primosomal protein N' (replication factor Y)